MDGGDESSSSEEEEEEEEEETKGVDSSAAASSSSSSSSSWFRSWTGGCAGDGDGSRALDEAGMLGWSVGEFSLVVVSFNLGSDLIYTNGHAVLAVVLFDDRD